MVNPLYWVSAAIYALILIIILWNDLMVRAEATKEEKAFRLLLQWVIFFCCQDVFWGICGGEAFHSEKAFFLASMIFHLSTVLTTFFWLYYVLTYLSDKIKHPKRLLIIDGVVVGCQVILLVVNCFYPIIFQIQDGIYVTGILRALAFFNQYVVYLLISIVTAVYTFRGKNRTNEKYVTVFIFSLAPVLSGIFQLLYPNGPFYSLGYFLGCFIIHMFVVTKERDELKMMLDKKKIELQIELANTDELTGLLNRRAYEAAMREYAESDRENNLVYMTVDINGLKFINDTKGHASGDELIKGTASCLKRCLGAYGKIYRIGGDEFASIFYADEKRLDFLKKDLLEYASRYHGEHIKELSFAIGSASTDEFRSVSLEDLAKISDERMYRAKGEYYSSKGIDRVGQQSAFTALCASYTKILKVNLTEDTYKIICMDDSEQTTEKGFAESISEWLHDFGISGQVHPDDLAEYLRKTNLAFLRSYFMDHSKNLNIFYRRKHGEIYRSTKMEMLPSEEYSDNKQSVYLYVKDIDK